MIFQEVSKNSRIHVVCATTVTGVSLAPGSSLSQASTASTGEKVTGIVTAITPTEVQVDVGAKQAAYIKFRELSDPLQTDAYA